MGTASSLVYSIDTIPASWSGTEYVYKILPYPVNLKQGGCNARSARKHVTREAYLVQAFQVSCSKFQVQGRNFSNPKRAT